jgi:hypothetical protein
MEIGESHTVSSDKLVVESFPSWRTKGSLRGGKGTGCVVPGGLDMSIAYSHLHFLHSSMSYQVVAPSDPWIRVVLIALHGNQGRRY